MTRAGLDKKPHEVAAMFDRTARRYDLVNDVVSMGQVRFWRRVVARAIDAGPGEVVLDLAGGTGASAETFTTLDARAICCDFSLGMLEVGRRRGPEGVTFVAGDALRLPFADGSADAVTISFGLRNVGDPDVALREMFRVARPGARLVICEFSHPVVPAFDLVYRRYLLKAIPAIARLVSSNPDSYEYLAESILDWPDQAALARRIQEAGWSRVAWRNLSLGAVAVHRAVR